MTAACGDTSVADTGADVTGVAWARPGPVADLVGRRLAYLEGLEAAPMACLLDTGALRIRMSAEIASLADIELSGDLTEEFYVGGLGRC